MNGLLTGKTTIVAGGNSKTAVDVVQSFLKEGATVIVPTSSSIQINKLKSIAKNINTGNLITALIDDADFERVTGFANHIRDRFKKIDLVVAAHGIDLPATPLTEIEIRGWQNVMDDIISSNFLTARVTLQWMKEQHSGMFVIISDASFLSNKNHSPLSRLASACQFEMSLIFSEEVKPFNVKYHHLFVEGDYPSSISAYNINKEAISPEKIGDSIVHLFTGMPQSREEVLQHLMSWPCQPDNIFFTLLNKNIKI